MSYITDTVVVAGFSTFWEEKEQGDKNPDILAPNSSENLYPVYYDDDVPWYLPQVKSATYINAAINFNRFFLKWKEFLWINTSYVIGINSSSILIVMSYSVAGCSPFWIVLSRRGTDQNDVLEHLL